MNRRSRDKYQREAEKKQRDAGERNEKSREAEVTWLWTDCYKEGKRSIATMGCCEDDKALRIGAMLMKKTTPDATSGEEATTYCDDDEAPMTGLHQKRTETKCNIPQAKTLDPLSSPST